MLRYYITDRRSVGGTPGLLRNLERLGNRFDIVQVREKDLGARELASLVRDVLSACHPSAIVLVNDRADVAMACGAGGVHLRSRSVSVPLMRQAVPAAFRISVSCHSVEDVRIASCEAADYALLSPIFGSPGKGVELGVELLKEAVRVSSIPVLALGGMDARRIHECEVSGAAGFAAIRYFQEPS